MLEDIHNVWSMIINDLIMSYYRINNTKIKKLNVLRKFDELKNNFIIKTQFILIYIQRMYTIYYHI